jgi:Cu/Zn superoxide dismutase
MPGTVHHHNSTLTSCFTVNPFGKQHGAPEDSERHVGDLGNIKTDGQGNAKGSVDDKQVKLIGEQSVLGVCLALFDIRRYDPLT